MSRFGEKQVYRYLEREKQAVEEEFTSSLETTDEGESQQGGTTQSAASNDAAIQ